MLLRAKPLEVIGPGLDLHVEVRSVGLAKAAIHAVGGDYEVVVAIQIEVRFRLGFEAQFGAQFRGPALEDAQQPLAPDSAEAVTAGQELAAPKVHLDVVPVGEPPADFAGGLWVVFGQVVERRVGKDHAPAEGVVGPVAFQHRDSVTRRAPQHRNGQVQPGRSAARNQ